MICTATWFLCDREFLHERVKYICTKHVWQGLKYASEETTQNVDDFKVK